MLNNLIAGLTTVRNKIDAVLKWALVIIMAVMTLNVLWQVFSRFVLGDPSSFTDELARYLLIWVGILGAGFVAGQKMHLAIDLLSTKLKGKSKSYLEIFIEVCIFIFALVVMVVGGIRLVYITLNLNQISAALQIHLGYVYLAIPISGLLMMFYSSFYILEELKRLKENKTETNN